MLISITCYQQEISSNIQIQSARAKAYCKSTKEGTVTKIQCIKDKYVMNTQNNYWFFECNFITIKFSYASYNYS